MNLENSENFNVSEVEVYSNWNSAIKCVESLLQQEILPFSLNYDQPGSSIDTENLYFIKSDPSTWFLKSNAKLRSNSIFHRAMWVCICAGKSKSKNNSEQINAQALSQQELFLMQSLYAVQYFNTITRKPGSVHVYFKNQHLDECKTHSSTLKTNPQIIQWVLYSRNSYLDANDKISTELLLKNLSCLESKQSPFNVENLSPNNSILFWQQQQCLCYKDSKEKGYYKSANYATGSTNQYRWLLYSIIIGDEGGHGIPLAFMITSWESHEPITKFFENKKWCRRISLDVRPTVIAFVRKLKLVITIEGFNQLEQDFIKWILTTNNLTKLLSYYKKEWQS
ncbi:hypothetical protein RhiirA5_505010 [Rhizophagus irregularis]|uniref:Uncharacterized protein n=1 Tax=Rhizophagus irregularis TaxID=588596 RepID=A0A2N0P1N8_9GLOM|nr:hypothetical protein RhiirA5_505010 [Rhizophagus irregularis]